MNPADDQFIHPLMERYASPAMLRLFAPRHRIRLWRELWIALAEGEQALGLDITAAQIAAMRAAADDIDLERAAAIEKETRHDVMAHIRAYGEKCPAARGIIHLGATSCFVTDNGDLIIMRDALNLVRDALVDLIRKLRAFSLRHAALPCLGFTHYQPAQLVTVGKRATLWMQDLLIDAQEVVRLAEAMRLRGVKGTTGTQASFMELFNNDEAKVRRLDGLVTARMGFTTPSFMITGQTYTRKVDSMILNALAGVAQSTSKMATDIRLLANLRELSEPFGKNQVGSSAMAYKQNPMRSERICALSRYVIVNALNPALTAAAQWLERTLDDSANRRMVVPESFLATDAIITIAANVTAGLMVHPAVIARRVADELPFMATENILMEAVKAGGDRQEFHEVIRTHSLAAADRVREGAANDLIARLKADAAFAAVRDRIDAIMDPRAFTGRAASQVTEFIRDEVDPFLAAYPGSGPRDTELKV